jgi:hypothetical protein
LAGGVLALDKKIAWISRVGGEARFPRRVSFARRSSAEDQRSAAGSGLLTPENSDGGGSPSKEIELRLKITRKPPTSIHAADLMEN